MLLSRRMPLHSTTLN